jgi:Cu-processing system permease protein
MNVIRTVFMYQLRDLIRSKWLIAYAFFFLLASEGLLRYGGGGGKALLSLGTIVLFVVPLVTIVYGTVYLYQSRDFIELLLAQPVRRGQLFAGLYLGITLALSVGVVAGLSIPFAVHGGLADASLRPAFATLVFAAATLTCIFTAVACVIALVCEDRLRGLGAAIATWLFLALLYDALVLVLVATFGDYALERPVLAAMLANPVDLARVLLLLRFDNAALMGYTGAVFQRFFAGAGALIAAGALLLWIAAPVYAGARAFRTKDF